MRKFRESVPLFSGVVKKGTPLSTWHQVPPSPHPIQRGSSVPLLCSQLRLGNQWALPQRLPVKTRVLIVPSVKICRTASRIWVSSSFNERNIPASSSSTCECCIVFSLWLLFLKAHKEEARKSGDSRVTISVPRTAFSQFLHASCQGPNWHLGCPGGRRKPGPGWGLKCTPLKNPLASSALEGPASGSESLSFGGSICILSSTGESHPGSVPEPES